MDFPLQKAINEFFGGFYRRKEEIHNKFMYHEIGLLTIKPHIFMCGSGLISQLIFKVCLKVKLATSEIVIIVVVVV